MQEPRDQEARTYHPRFDETMQDKAREKALALEEKARQTPNFKERNLLIQKANSYHEAINVLEDMTKADAVDWIQEETGGKKSAEMDDAGEYAGVVYSRQTHCDVLSKWPEIFRDVAGIIEESYRLQDDNS